MAVCLISVILVTIRIGHTQGTIELPRTGQTTAYYPGDDGDLQTGVPWPEPRFIDHGDGTITDSLTGLMWTKDANLPRVSRSWDETIRFVADMNAGFLSNYGHSDWRLPNIVELESLVDSDEDFTTWLESQGFQNVTNDYWSSNTNPYDSLLVVVLYYSGVGGSGRNGSRYVWPVRGETTGHARVWKTGQTISYAAGDDGDLRKGVIWPDPRFRNNGDGTVTDKLTGLIWLQDTNCFGSLPWEEGLSGIGDFNVNPVLYSCQNYTATNNDWRLPNRKELRSLIDYSKYNPPLTEGHPFINMGEQSAYWSSTSNYFGNPYFVHVLGNGDVGDIFVSFLPIWPVRGGTIAEHVTTPLSPSGVTLETIGTISTYSTGGSVSSLGHVVEYQFDWGDGTYSDWVASGVASKSWNSIDIFRVRVRARCAEHITVVSDWSLPLQVMIILETISVPSFLTGSSTGTTGIEYTYATGGASTNLSHEVQYLFDWGDGTDSGWLSAGNANAAHSWALPGAYYVKAKARCATNTSIESRWSSELAVNISGFPETISAPTSLTGINNGISGTEYTYTISGSISSFGHSVEYQFDWKGDGSDLSPWGSATQSRTWTVGGVYNVQGRARCTIHPSVVSDWSETLSVTISPPVETVSTPSTPSGPTNGIQGTTYAYSVGGSSSNLDHSVQYLFDWGDGTDSGWLPVGTATAQKSWPTPGTYLIKVQARCATHTSVVSGWSDTLSVAISIPVGFNDVPVGHWAHSQVVAMAVSGITGGCSSNPPMFCPDAPVTRAQMAVFMTTSLGRSPAASCTGTFSDVNTGTVSDLVCRYIEDFAAAGITGGCGDGKICPNDPVTRAQMAVFIEAALNVTPGPTCTGTFSDVDVETTGDLFCRFIEDFASKGITGGCGEGRYCPNEPVTRAQMAVFLVAAPSPLSP